MELLLTDCATLCCNNDLNLDIFKDFGKVTLCENATRKELLKKIKNTDILLCNKTVIDKEIMDAAENLKYIGLFATGYNNIDINYAKEKGIRVCNAGSYSTSAVAQQVFAYILAHFCKVSEYDGLVKGGKWVCSPTFSMLSFPTDELQGKTLGIIGFGSIGRRVAEIAKAFEMKVLVYTRTVKEYDGISFVSLSELLENSDIVTVHCPLNPQSDKMFNKETFSKMKKGAFFINTARGGVVDEEALRDALNSGQLSGAGIDVLEIEPMSNSCVLTDAKNLIITPHTAWTPLATRNRLLKIVYDNITAFLEGKELNKIV